MRRLEFGDQSGAFRAKGEQSRVGSLIWQFRRRLPRYEGPSPPHRPSTGPEWAFVHTPLNRGRRKKTVSCKRGHRSALKRPSWSLRVLTSQALHEGQANHFDSMVSCEHEIRTEDATMIITDAFLVSFMRIVVGAQSVIQSRYGLRSAMSTACRFVFLPLEVR